MNIRRSASIPSAIGSEAYFTGRVRIDSPFQTPAPARVGGATVTWLEPVSDAQYRWSAGQD
ncbi:hypothetical protein [Sodalis glossinidius]|uniref:hypothetical protein n=1 Tax=Sodalis glossinidius TaxID=63612 RepID=UPI0002E8BC3D